MRIARTFTIEEDIIKKLNESGNRSELINRILEEYFKKNDINNMSREELKKAIKIEKLNKQIEELSNG